MSSQSSGAQLRLGLPIAPVVGAVAAAGDAGHDRLYLEVPLSLLRAAMPEVVGHTVTGREDEPIVIELDDEDFNVSGSFNRA